jgi:hypothetical protein
MNLNKPGMPAAEQVAPGRRLIISEHALRRERQPADSRPTVVRHTMT